VRVVRRNSVASCLESCDTQPTARCCRFQLAAEISYGEFDGGGNVTPAIEDRHRDGGLVAFEFVARRGHLRQPDDRQFLA
jgi:hypothetical protein